MTGLPDGSGKWGKSFSLLKLHEDEAALKDGQDECDLTRSPNQAVEGEVNSRAKTRKPAVSK
jgi:hypothetical protein